MSQGDRQRKRSTGARIPMRVAIAKARCKLESDRFHRVHNGRRRPVADGRRRRLSGKMICAGNYMSGSGDEFPPEVSERLNRARASRHAVQAKDPAFFHAISGAMFKHDPIGINLADNTDEYDAEAGTVIPRLSTCQSPEDVASVLHEEFQSWFGADTAGNLAAYRNLATEIWLIMERRDA